MQALAADNALDFDDLLLSRCSFCRKTRFAATGTIVSVTLVDEYQDTNRTQYDLIKLLVTDEPQNYDDWAGRSVFVVGDADQSIYSFRLQISRS